MRQICAKLWRNLKSLLLKGAVAGPAGDGQGQACPASAPVNTSDSPTPASDAIPSVKVAAGADAAGDAGVQQLNPPIEPSKQVTDGQANDIKGAPAPASDLHAESDEDEPAFQCPECEATFADEDQAVTVYECAACNDPFTRDESPNGSNQCPECNQFGRKLTDLGCPECHVQLEEMPDNYPQPTSTSGVPFWFSSEPDRARAFG